MIDDRLKEWERNVLEKSLKKIPEREKEFVTTSGIKIPRVIVKESEIEKLGLPGDFPFTRGIQPTMYRSRIWTMRQYAGFGTPEETNSRFKYLLNQGQTGLSLAFDLPTQMGYDSDHPLAISEVGRTGVAIDTVNDLDEVFSGIPLDRVSVSFTINATAMIILAMFYVIGKLRGVPNEKLRGTVQNDILKEYAARGTFAFPPEPSLRLTVDIIEFCGKQMPEFNPISVSGYHIREAGSTAVQEAAFAICSGIEYMKRSLERGLVPDDFAHRVTFFFSCHNNFFEEIAKFRASRRVWAYIMKDRFSAKKSESMKLRFHTQTSGVTLVAKEPENNILRVAYQALASALGGSQSIHTNSFDEALALPSESAVLLALRTQQILAYETGITDTVDALGGSYFVEYMTDEMEDRIKNYIEIIDNIGGMAEAVRSGFVQKEIAKSAWEYQKMIEDKKVKIVGVNILTEGSDTRPQKIEILKVPDEIIEKKIKNLKKVKAERDNSKVEKCLKQLRDATLDKKINLMEPVIECVENFCTLGEICSTFESIWGRFRLSEY